MHNKFQGGENPIDSAFDGMTEHRMAAGIFVVCGVIFPDFKEPADSAKAKKVKKTESAVTFFPFRRSPGENMNSKQLKQSI